MTWPHKVTERRLWVRVASGQVERSVPVEGAGGAAVRRRSRGGACEAPRTAWQRPHGPEYPRSRVVKLSRPRAGAGYLTVAPVLPKSGRPVGRRDTHTGRSYHAVPACLAGGVMAQRRSREGQS